MIETFLFDGERRDFIVNGWPVEDLTTTEILRQSAPMHFAEFTQQETQAAGRFLRQHCTLGNGAPHRSGYGSKPWRMVRKPEWF
jgi:hypothetical protein